MILSNMSRGNFAKNIAGQTFGSLTVIKRNEPAADKRRRALWIAKCNRCEQVAIFPGESLRVSRAQDCRCYSRKQKMPVSCHPPRGNTFALKHGHRPSIRGSREYCSWQMMKQRCLNPNHTGYSDYGGRGITVCERWCLSFKHFLEDMGERPSGMSIDRINSNGNYEPSNCRWATPKQQRNNRRMSYKKA